MLNITRVRYICRLLFIHYEDTEMKKNLHNKSPRKVRGKKGQQKTVKSGPRFSWESVTITYLKCRQVLEAALLTGTHAKNPDVLERLSVEEKKTLADNLKIIFKNVQDYQKSLDDIFSEHSEKTHVVTKTDETFEIISYKSRYEEWLKDWTVNVADSIVLPTLNLIRSVTFDKEAA